MGSLPYEIRRGYDSAIIPGQSRRLEAARPSLSRNDSVGFAPHLLDLRLMCFVVRHLRISLQYARASRLAHQPNPLRI
jgi:hypothetical protein